MSYVNDFEVHSYITDPNHPARKKDKKPATAKHRFTALILFLLSFFVYPALIPIHPEQRALFGGLAVPDIFMYWRSALLCAYAITLSFVQAWSIGAFLLWLPMIVSVLLSKHVATAIYGTTNYYEGAAEITAYIFLFSQTHFPERAVKWAAYIVGAFGLLQYIYGCYFILSPVYWLMPKGIHFAATAWPIYSTLGNPNHLGLFCALLFPFFLARRQFMPSAVLLALLVGCQSRFAWVSVVITTLIQFRKQWPVVILCTLILLSGSAARIIDGAKAIHWPPQDEDMSGRAMIWAETIPMLKNHWITGSGPGSFALDFPNQSDRKKAVFGDSIVDRPHNIYLNIWYSTGFLSLLLLGWLVLDFYKRCTDPALRMSVLGFLLAGFFTDSVVSVTPYFMAMFGAGFNNKQFTNR